MYLVDNRLVDDDLVELGANPTAYVLDLGGEVGVMDAGPGGLALPPPTGVSAEVDVGTVKGAGSHAWFHLLRRFRAGREDARKQKDGDANT